MRYTAGQGWPDGQPPKNVHISVEKNAHSTLICVQNKLNSWPLCFYWIFNNKFFSQLVSKKPKIYAEKKPTWPRWLLQSSRRRRTVFPSPFPLPFILLTWPDRIRKDILLVHATYPSFLPLRSNALLITSGSKKRYSLKNERNGESRFRLCVISFSIFPSAATTSEAETVKQWPNWVTTSLKYIHYFSFPNHLSEFQLTQMVRWEANMPRK